MDDETRRANEQLIGDFFHQSRSDAKARKKGLAKGETPVSHRHNTKLVGLIEGGKKRR